MKNYFYILILNSQIRSLKKERNNMLNRIGVLHDKEVQRLNLIEDFNPDFFRKIDKKIESRKRLLKIVKNKLDN